MQAAIWLTSTNHRAAPCIFECLQLQSSFRILESDLPQMMRILNGDGGCLTACTRGTEQTCLFAPPPGLMMRILKDNGALLWLALGVGALLSLHRG